MMPSYWFRMYAEVLNDPKVQNLPGDLFKIWVNALCIACNGNGTLPKLEDVSFALRLPFHETKTAFQELEKHALLVTVDETFQFKSWNKRQYKSDVSTERVKRHRERKRNVTETPPDTDTDTEQKVSTDANASLRARPAKAKFTLEELSVDHITDWLAKKRAEGRYLLHDECFVLEYFKNYCVSKGKKYKDFIAAYRNAFEWEACRPRSANGSGRPQTFAEIREAKNDEVLERVRQKYADPS